LNSKFKTFHSSASPLFREDDCRLGASLVDSRGDAIEVGKLLRGQFQTAWN